MLFPPLLYVCDVLYLIPCVILDVKVVLSGSFGALDRLLDLYGLKCACAEIFRDGVTTPELL
jgi:hypothetical protein